MEPEIECEDEYYYDPTLLTFQIDGNILFNGGLEYLCKQQELTGNPMHMALKNYDVVISVTKPKPKLPEIVCVHRMEEKKKEKWNENVETCSDCGIHWKKIGKSCPVCYAPAERHDVEG